ncbi:hypothetical protein VNI00_018326 [Paramarasmius palmivorus]|uniref:DUF6535 domain-containing protein n=1 Tax=Paramarasmius palmivorus TaxID=297713 RepID=A0AAW0B1J1_9AGAR
MEEEKMRNAYHQLKEDLWKEHWEQRTQKKKAEELKEEQEWKQEEEEERKREEYEERKRDEEDWEQRQKRKQTEKKRKEEQKQKKQKAADPAYEKLQAEVKKYDDGLVAGYKEDIDTLLVFASLFSAVVTAFLIESYQWLSEDTTVIILAQISHQLNGTQTQSAPFTPEASAIRINCFWFLSLIFSLTSALFALLCKQWLREHQRDVPTRTAGEDLALRQLRRDSFEKWGVTSFLSALPILLEIAVIFFFVGVLDLLWTLHRIPFGICLPSIVLSVGLYFITTILPTISIPHDQKFISTWDSQLRHYHYDFGPLAYQFICPYKSPQAWAFYRLSITLTKPFLRFPLINMLAKIHLRPLWDHVQAQTSSWSAFDLRVVRQFDQEVYELQALQWAATIFRDSPLMIPHLENVLEACPEAVPAILDQWDITMWDIGWYLRHPYQFPRFNLTTSDPLLHSQEGIELLFRHLLWHTLMESISIAPSLFLDSHFNQLNKEICSGMLRLKLFKTSRFFIPIPLAIALWSHMEPQVRQLSLQLLLYFEQAWKTSPEYNERQHNEERVAFANALTWHIQYSDQRSVLLTSQRAWEFIRFIHKEIIIRRLYSHRVFNRGGWWGWGWIDVLKKVQEVGELPNDYFTPLPEEDEDPPSQLPQLEPIHYSMDTVHPQSDNPHNEDKERPPSPGDNIKDNIEIQVLGSRGNTVSRVANLADDALVLSDTNQDGSGLQPINKSDTSPLENSQLAASRMMVAGSTNFAGSEIQIMASKDVAEHVSVPLSAGEGKSPVLKVAIPPDTNPDHLTQATEDGAEAISLLLEGAKDKHRLEMIDEDTAETNGLAASRRTDRPQESAEDLLAPLSAGEDEPGASREIVPPDTDPYRPMLAIVGVAQDIASLSEG